MPAEPEPVTVAQVVNRAVDVVDPMGQDPDVADLFARFEDSDEPVTAVLDIDQVMAEAVGAIDPEGEQPALQMAGAAAVHLAHRRDQLDDEADSILRLAARSQFDGDPPPAVADWLAAQGIEA